MGAEQHITERNRAAMAKLFEHRVINPAAHTDLGDKIAMLDNVGEALDHACAMARVLFVGIGRAEAELDASDLRNVAWAISNQIQDAQAFLDAWHTATHAGTATFPACGIDNSQGGHYGQCD